MWGQEVVSKRLPFVPGIIPTRVGTSFIDSYIKDISTDHPHACGDKLQNKKVSR